MSTVYIGPFYLIAKYKGLPKACIAIVNTHTGLLLMFYVSLIDYSVSYCPRSWL